MAKTKLVRVAILGDFDAGKHSHWATEAALFHAAQALELRIAPEWVDTASLACDGHGKLECFNGVFGAPGSPYRSAEGVLRGIEYARLNDVPYLGTCAGFQHALIEFTRNVLGIAGADTAEAGVAPELAVITAVACALPDPSPLLPRLSGARVMRIATGTLLHGLYQSESAFEAYYCSFEANPAFEARWREAGLRVAARGSNGELRAFELPDRRFFVAALFQPQLSSAASRPHPLLIGYLRACAE